MPEISSGSPHISVALGWYLASKDQEFCSLRIAIKPVGVAGEKKTGSILRLMESRHTFSLCACVSLVYIIYLEQSIPHIFSSGEKMHACQIPSQDKNFISLARIDFPFLVAWWGTLALMTWNTLNIIKWGGKPEECGVNLMWTPVYWGN